MLEDRQVSAVELANVFLARIERYRGLNAFLDVRPELTLQQARAADARRARGERGALLGMPIAHKDIFVTRAGLDRRQPDAGRLSEPVRCDRGRTAGASRHWWPGKLNCDEFAMGSSNENSAFGNVLNPWMRRSAGRLLGRLGAAGSGASGAVANRHRHGGSIREPPAFTGITGIKPPMAAVSLGMIAFASSLDTAGCWRPARRTARWCSTRCGSMRATPPACNCRRRITPVHWTSICAACGSACRPFFTQGLQRTWRRRACGARADRQLGASLLEVELPNAPLGIPVYYVWHRRGLQQPVALRRRPLWTPGAHVR